jgi:23S rRNA pseudouridine1911/1915/1917 synthase
MNLPDSDSLREWTVPHLAKPQRLDQYLMLQGIHKSRTYLQRMIRDGEVAVNGKSVKTSFHVRAGDRIRVHWSAPRPLTIGPEPIPLNIIYEDSELVVLDKPAGLVMHPAPGHYTGTLVNALLHHCRDLSGIGGRERPGIVHRLDKGTSGVLVVAKSDTAHIQLSRQFSEHTVSRTYWALVGGVIKKGEFELDLAIGRDRRDRKKISPRTQKPRRAKTLFRVLRRFSDATQVEARPKTGRTHQIRVHLADLGYPILGDRDYGGRRAQPLEDFRFERPMLHARHLGFTHPVSGDRLEFEAPLPKDMSAAVDFLSRQRRG